MQPHEKRVIDEHVELSNKLEKLNQFITSSPVYQSLPEIERQLLFYQAKAMDLYSAILWDRISLFTEDI